MKKIFLTLFLANLFLLNTSCSDSYDDSALRGRVDGLEERVVKLEELCKQMNTNISSLQTLVTALQAQDCITAVTPIEKDGKTAGYTITFKISAPITIYNGKDGVDGSTPKIGVAKLDDVYFWTVNGEWLTDDSGDKIKAEGATGSPGANGVTPQLKIEDCFWYISTDNGKTWTKLGQAIGDKGDSLFTNVSESDTEVTFTLADGTTITLPKGALSTPLEIAFSGDGIEMLPGGTYEIEYTLSGATEKTLIDVVAQNGYYTKVVRTDFKSGKIVITAPTPASDDRIIVLVSDGAERTLMRFINIAKSLLIVTTDAFYIEQEGGTQTVEVETNINYEVCIAEADQEWVSLLETRAPHRTETLTFSFKPNPSTTYRYATVELRDIKGQVGQSILFSQKSWEYKTLHVEKAGMLGELLQPDEKEHLLGLFLSGTLDASDFAVIRNMPSLEFADLSKLTNTTLPEGCFQETAIETVILPSKLIVIPDNAFRQSQILAINIPATVTLIGDYAFNKCIALTGSLNLPEGLQRIGKYAFNECSSLTGSLVIPDSVIEMGEYAFNECTGFNGTLTFGGKLSVIPERSFYNCYGFTGDLILPEETTTIQHGAFMGCVGFMGNLVLGSKMRTLDGMIFCQIKDVNMKYYILNFTKIYCKAVNPPQCTVVGTWGDLSYKYMYLSVPRDCRDAYISASIWDVAFHTYEEVDF